MKLIAVALLGFWFGICLSSGNRISSNRINGHADTQYLNGISDFGYERGLRQEGNGLRHQENGIRQPGNELSNTGGSPGIAGIPGFVYEAGLRQDGNGLRRQENGQIQKQNGFRQPENGLTNTGRSQGTDGIPDFANGAGLRQEENGFRREEENGFTREEENGFRRQENGFQSQIVDSNSVIKDKNILTQRFQYQDDVKASPSPAMTHFQIPGIKHSSQGNNDFDQASSIVPSQQFAQQADVLRASPGFSQTSSATHFQESEIRQPSFATRFPASETKQFSESSDLRSPSQQFPAQEPELKARPSFPPSIATTFETSHIKESSQPITHDPQAQEKTQASRQFEGQTRYTQNIPTSVFPSRSSEDRRVQGSSEITSQIRDGTLAKTRQSQQLTAQKTDSRVSSDFQPSIESTFQRPGARKPFEETREIPQSQFEQFSAHSQSKPSPQHQRFVPQTIESTRTQISETRHPPKLTLQDEFHRSQGSQTQESFSDQESETDAQRRFPAKPSVAQFQVPGIRQSLEPTRVQPELEGTRTTHDQQRQSQQFSQQETETNARPQFSQSLLPQVSSPIGQTFQSQQFATRKTSQPRFPTQDQRLQTQHLPQQEVETKARPQFPPSSVTKVSDTRQTSKVDEKEPERQTLQSQETDIRAQTRFPSLPSAFQETRQPSAVGDAFKPQREEAAAVTLDRRFPTQQITSIESEKKTPTSFSSPQVSHFQAAGTQLQQQEPSRPFVGLRQESFSLPQRFQTNLFRDVGYASPPVHNRPNVALVKSHNIGPTDDRAYAFIFESEDGIIREEQGGYTDPDKGLTAKTGSFSYISPDGTIVETTYIADERGYRTQSSPLARIDDPDLPAGKYDRFRSALASSRRNEQNAVKTKTEQETRTRF